METNKLSFDQIPNYLLGIGERVAKIENLLSCLKLQDDSGIQEKPINVSVAAEFVELEESTIYKHVHLGTIPFHKKARKLYFYKSELNAWIKTIDPNSLSRVEKEAEETFLAAQKRRK